MPDGADLLLPKRTGTPEPFRSTQAAWLWCMRMLLARQDGAGAAFGTGGARICEPDDIVEALDRLYRQRRIDLAHARILRLYGERGYAPRRDIPKERGDERLWMEAIAALDAPLRARGIVR